MNDMLFDKNKFVCNVLFNSKPKDEFTLVVVGAFRGGTSMVTAVLMRLGLFMGDEVSIGNWEDLEMRRNNNDIGGMKKIIECRDDAHKVWGWKDPSVVEFLPEIVSELRNPRIVMVFRDILAIAQTESFRRDGRVFSPWFLDFALQQQIGLLSCLNKLSCPVILCSFERALRNKVCFVKEIADFVGVDFSSSAVDVIGEHYSAEA